MKKKDILYATAIVNAGLLCTLFIVGLLTTDKKADVITQLDHSKPAMLQVQPILSEQVVTTGKEEIKEDTKIVYKLPKAPEKAVAVEAEKPKVSFPKPTPVTPKVVEKKAEVTKVIVVKNDTLEALARKNQSTVEAIIAYNDLKTPLLKIGQALTIPKIKQEPTPKPKQEETVQYYVVKVGDNPWTIAMKHHMKVKTLLDLNNLDDKKARKIRPGDKLRVR